MKCACDGRKRTGVDNLPPNKTTRHFTFTSRKIDSILGIIRVASTHTHRELPPYHILQGTKQKHAIMEGRGVINYNTARSSYGVSTETTEFDDQLIQRGILSFEECMMRHKGVSYEEAVRLKHWKEHGTTTTGLLETSTTQTESQSQTQMNPGDNGKTTNDPNTSDDDLFLDEYRQKRIQEIKAMTTGHNDNHPYGQVMLISRQDWTRQVNDASQTTWVVVSLTCSDTDRTGCMDMTMQQLAAKFDTIKFVIIPYHHAIANWPEEHLPTLFLYRYGTMQHQLVSLPTTMSDDELEWKLAQLGVLDTDLEEEPKTQRRTNVFTPGSYRGTVFGGTGCQLKTRADVDDTNTDYDDVD